MSHCDGSDILVDKQLFRMRFKKRREEQGMMEIKEQDAMSPKSDCRDEIIGHLLRERFARLHERQKMQVVRSALNNLFGRHHPVNYRPQYHFRERWEEVGSPLEQRNRYSFLRSENIFLNIIYVTIFILYGVMLWFLSVYRLLCLSDLFQPLVMVSIMSLISDGVIKLLHYINQDQNGKIDIRAYLKGRYQDYIFLAYLVALFVEDVLFQEKTYYLLPIDAAFLVIGYRRFEEMFAGVKIAILSSPYRYQMQIVQLVCGCLLKVHLFSLLLFLASRINHENNWTVSILNFGESWLTRYIYSLYFTCTTMFTVGYGDITPKSLPEVVAIMLIQVIGIINLGYIINEIGRFLSKINEGQEVLYKNISKAETVIDTYKLPKELASRMRNYLINNTLSHHEVNLQEEDLFLRKLNDDIRSDIDSYHKLETVKTSIFFICQWSKKFKQRVAEHLLKVLYTPQETLVQVPGKQRLFVLVNGKVDIGISMQSRNGNSIVKTLRVITNDPQNQVQNNVYGYSSLISGLRVRLQAVAKDYCICYTIGKDQLQQIIEGSERDFEYYHVIKAKVEGSKIREEWQAPQVLNAREHYSPNPYYVLKKDRLDRHTQRRYYRQRISKRISFIIQADPILTQNQMSNSEEETTRIHRHIDVLSKGERRTRYDATLAADCKKMLISTRDYRHRLKKREEPSEQELLRKIKEDVLNNFEEGKRYHEYFPKWNKPQSIIRCNKFLGRHQSQQATGDRQTKILIHGQITEQVAQKLLNIKTIASSHHNE